MQSKNGAWSRRVSTNLGLGAGVGLGAGLGLGLGVATCLVALLAAGCGEPVYTCNQRDDRPAVPAWDPQSLQPLYDPATNPFAQPIGSSPTLHSDSASMVQALRKDFDAQGFTVGVGEWTDPVYLADKNTPRQDVKLRAGWSPYKQMLGVPVPGYARPDPSYDGELVVLDQDAGLEYDFWQFCYDPDQSYASWVNVIELGSSGIFEKGMATRAAGFTALNGILWPYELAAGAIEHALAFSFNLTRDGGPVAPATASDGTSHGALSIPEGARVQLDPSLDLSRPAYGLTPTQQVIGKALQDYGMILVDDGGGLQLYAAGAQGFADPEVYRPFFTLDAEGQAAFPASFPVDSFRVLDFGPQLPDATGDGVVMHPERYQ